MIVADENIDFIIISELRKEGYKVISIAEDYRGFTDEDVIEVVKIHEAILITKDKDFGEWVFAHGRKGFSVIFLRYENEIFDIINNILHVLNQIYATKVEYNPFLKKLHKKKPSVKLSNIHQFITITKSKTRFRTI